MDPSAAPWRTIDGATPAASEPAETHRLPAGAVAALVLAGILAVLAVGVSVAGSHPSIDVVTSSGGPRDADAPAASGELTTAVLVVQVAGAVVHPGVQRLPAGSRVGDLIAAAGGFGPRVDTARAEQELNLAAPLTDGQRVVVPSRDDAPTPSTRSVGSGGNGGSPSGPLDLNSATEEELDTLPGIGPVTAAKIVAARDQQRFATVDDLRSRKLVGASTFDRIKSLVTVR